MDPIDPAYIERIWSDSIPQLPRAERLNRAQPQQQPEQYPQDDSTKERRDPEGQDEDFYEPSSESGMDAGEFDGEDGYDPNWRAGQLAADDSIVVNLGSEGDRESGPGDDEGHAHIDITV